MAKYYGIGSVGEVKAYADSLLSKNMSMLCSASLKLENCSAIDIFGDVDAKK